MSNLIEIYAHMHRRTDFETVGQELSVHSMSGLKKELTDCVVDGLRPIRTEYARIMKEQGYLAQVAEEGAARARKNAEATMVLVRKAIGFA